MTPRRSLRRIPLRPIAIPLLLLVSLGAKCPANQWPVLQHATCELVTPTLVYLRYNRAMDPATAGNPANYALSDGLSVSAASVSADQKLVTLTASGGITVDSTTVTAHAAITSTAGFALAETTLTIEEGDSLGVPAALQVGLSLSTDGNESVIQQKDTRPLGFNPMPDRELQVTLTITAPGSDATPVTIKQANAPGGAGSVYMGPAPSTDTSVSVLTSGGTTNTAQVILRGAATSSFKDDLKLQAYVLLELRGEKPATVIKVSASPLCLYLADQRPVTQTITVTPPIAGIQLTAKTWLVDVRRLSPTTLFAVPDPPPTNTGETHVTFTPCGTDQYRVVSYQVSTDNAQDNEKMGKAADVKENSRSGVTYQGGGPGDAGPAPGTADGNSSCGCGVSVDDSGGSGVNVEDSGGSGNGGKSVDPSDGEKKLDVTDLVIAGRGPAWAFRRVYRSHDYRQVLGLPEDFGSHWTFSYANERLLKDGSASVDTANYVNLRGGQSGGAYVNTAPNRWGSPLEHYTQLRRNLFTGDFEIREEDGDVRVYHPFGIHPTLDGRLKALKDNHDNTLTFLYDLIDPDDTIAGDSKYVLSRVIDALGREIRYQYYAKTSQSVAGRPVTIEHPASNSAAWGRLAKVIDFKGDMDFDGTPQSEDFPGQVNNRTLTFDYDEEGNLVRISQPAIAGTPTGNDFPQGKTVRYQYITNANRGGLSQGAWDALTQEEKDRLLHKLTHIWYPNEVRNAADTNPPEAEAAEVVGYETDPTDPFFGFATSHTIGGTNGNEVPSGGAITYTYTDLNPNRGMGPAVSIDPTLLYTIKTMQVDISDRNGNQAQYVYGGGGTLLEYREFTRGFRAVEPAEYLMTFAQNKDRLLKTKTLPQDDQVEWAFNERSTDRSQQSNVIRTIRTPDPARGGDQAKIETVTVYEPIYNRPYLRISARGADVGNNDFTPPIPDPASRLMPDPYDASKTVDLRYATIDYFDFQESPERAADAPDERKDIDGTGGRVNQSPLIAVDPNVLTTEVLLIQELGLFENAFYLTELRNRLSASLMKLGLGDLNADGETTPHISGDIVRTVRGSPVLIEGSNQHALETQIEAAGDLIDETKSFMDGGSQEGAHGGRLQTIVAMYQYNQFGQPTKTISPEGNVVTYEYFPETDPDGDTQGTPAPADGRMLDLATGGYLKTSVSDTTRTYFAQDGMDKSGASFNNNATNPAVTDITTRYTYDDVGNPITMTNGRGIRADYFVNEHDEMIQALNAADISGAAFADPPDPLIGDPLGPLTAFAYKDRTFFDYNGNAVLRQTEDRGNTSGVDGSGLGLLPAQATNTTPGLAGADTVGGDAYVDALRLYDRLNNQLEDRVEVDATRSLDTRYRYDGNQHRVFTIYPEGNARSAVYDERDLLFQETRGEDTRPLAALYAPGDPTSFDRPGGAGTVPSTTAFNYDKNANLVEVVDAADTDGSGSNNSAVAGDGDASRVEYDGYDRKRTLTDPMGNRTTYHYDPDSNVIRRITDGAPVADEIGDSGNKTLEVTEWVHDELSRVLLSHRVLFETPGVTPARPPVLADGVAMDALAAYLADASGDTSSVPGATGIAVVGRISTLTEHDRGSRSTFLVGDDLDAYRTDYDGVSRVVKTTDSATGNAFLVGSFAPALLAGNARELAYDDDSNVIETKETDVTDVPDVADEVFRTTFLYDALGRLQTRVDSIGQTADYRYDSRNNLVASADPVGPVSTRTVNRRGLGSAAPIAVNDFGNVTRYTYDGLSRGLESEALLTASGQGDGVHIGADLAGVKGVASTVDGSQAGDGLISIYNAYDDNSLVLARRDDNGNTTASIYDNQNRPNVVRQGLNVVGTTLVIAGGDVGMFNVPLRGGTPAVDTEAAGTAAATTYDQESNIQGQTDEAGNVFACTFDALNRQRSCTITRASGFVGTANRAVSYDGLSRIREGFDNNAPESAADDVAISYIYDSLSRMLEEAQLIGSSSPRVTSFDFDIESGQGVAKPTTLTYPDGRQLERSYDRLDRLLTQRDTGQTSDIGTYEYIGATRVALLTYQNGTRLSRISQSGGQNVNTGFDGLRRVVAHRWEAFTSEPLGSGTLVVGFSHRDGGGNPSYDRANNRRIEEKLHTSTNSEVYAYDSAYRLVTFDRGTLNGSKTAITTPTPLPGALQAQTWTLDGANNWSSTTHSTGGASAMESRTHSDFNEVVGVAGMPYGAGATGTHVLDTNGNLLDDGVRTYEWDALNRLRAVYRKSDGAQIAAYNYDFLGRRVRKDILNGGLGGAETSGSTDFSYAAWRVVEERNSSEQVVRQYVYGNYIDEVWAVDDRAGGATIEQLNDNVGGERQFYHGSILYSVHALTNETGAVVEGYQYDAYGRQTVFKPGANGTVDFGGDDTIVIGGSSQIGNPYLFTGQRFDPETGLYYYRKRFYSPDLGRFISRDPLGSGLGNRYAYVGDNPVNFVDVFGLQEGLPEVFFRNTWERASNPAAGQLDAVIDIPPPQERVHRLDIWVRTNVERGRWPQNSRSVYLDYVTLWSVQRSSSGPEGLYSCKDTPQTCDLLGTGYDAHADETMYWEGLRVTLMRATLSYSESVTEEVLGLLGGASVPPIKALDRVSWPLFALQGTASTLQTVLGLQERQKIQVETWGDPEYAYQDGTVSTGWSNYTLTALIGMDRVIEANIDCTKARKSAERHNEEELDKLRHRLGYGVTVNWEDFKRRSQRPAAPGPR